MGGGVGRGGGGSRGSFTPCNLFAVLIVCSTLYTFLYMSTTSD